ncbi:GDSL-type esterase/lipase family protein [Hazenella coriacea]|uniref:Lysophospholipase L1-like esterase n=1 Tax=Hazenella coriacea TaxID=1179467 RepID=A0A4R3LB56_9BACL|nr:GDSL-type esterase/lipase family protein [Hazenella coriacea]TCS96415.1 lysophospholipase L1-like esterase [Hazenella coriacea]
MNHSVYYIALGDSITFGTGALMRQGYAILIANQLRKTYPYVYFTNISRKGLTSQGLTSIIQNPRLQAFLQQAQLITLLIGGNDLNHAYLKYLITGNKLEINKALSIYSLQFNNLLQWLGTYTSAKIYSFTLYNPFPNEPLSNQIISTLNLIIIKHSKRWNVTVVDLNKPFMNQQAKYIAGYRTGRFNDFIPFIQQNPIHPNTLGHHKIAQLFWDHYSSDLK